MGTIHVTIDSRLRLDVRDLPKDFVRGLKSGCTYDNPDYHKRRNSGRSTWGVESKIATYTHDEATGAFTLPRGATTKLRKACAAHGLGIRWFDRRVKAGPVTFPTFQREPRWYQEEATAACLLKQQGIVRAPTGSGKTTAALYLISKTDQPWLVVMRDSQLLTQWIGRAQAELGMSAREIGVLRGGEKLRIGDRLTFALQQTLYSEKFPIESIANAFGGVLVDEVQGLAARTFQEVIDMFPAFYRFGFSADETRKDGFEFFTYDLMGDVLHETTREQLEAEGAVMPVTVRFVPTDFRADWYRDAWGGDRDFNRLIEEITGDVQRNEILLNLARDLVQREESPVLMFSHRIEHARWIADVGMLARRIRCGLMLGGKPAAARYEAALVGLRERSLDVAVGTFNAVGTGIDMPAIHAGVMATPIGKNRQFFNQVRGRVCRNAPGKTTARLYVLWDRHVFPDAPKVYAGWNGGNVEIWNPETACWVPWRR